MATPGSLRETLRKILVLNNFTIGLLIILLLIPLTSVAATRFAMPKAKSEGS
jgi:hypothetical protein